MDKGGTLMSRILIKNAAILTMEDNLQLIDRGGIMIEDGRIVAVGLNVTGDGEWQAEKVIDGTNKVVLPGFVNTHTHAAMSLLRGYADDLPLMDWLSKKIWPLEDKLTPEDIYWGSKLAILEMIKSGTTTFADMYFEMEETAKAVEEMGIRACLSRGMIGVAPNAEIAMKESKAFIAKWKGGANGRITVMLGPHAPYTCPPEYLKRVINLADELNVGIHIHLAETKTEVEDIKKQYNEKTPVMLMEELGLFNRQVVAAHCVHLTQEEIETLAKRGVGVAHNPESNMKLASGIAPVPQMLEAGVNVALGTDGAASNNNLSMLDEIKAAALIHKVNTLDPTVVPAYQALKMATINGAKALGLEKEIGSIAVGKKADLIILGLDKPHLTPRHDLVAHLVYAANSSDIETVIVDGKILVEENKLISIDEQEILLKAHQAMEGLLSR